MYASMSSWCSKGSGGNKIQVTRCGDWIIYSCSPVTFTECEYYESKKWTQNSMWKKFPDRWDSLSVCLVVSQSLAQFREEQLSWLNESLGNVPEVWTFWIFWMPQTDWKFVVGHHPLLSATVPRYDNKVLERDLLPIFQAQATLILPHNSSQ